MSDNGLAKLKTMDCDVIWKSLYAAMGHLCDADLELMADVLFEVVEPIASERAHVQYRYVLASQHPDEPGKVILGFVDELSDPNAADLAAEAGYRNRDGKLIVVEMKRIARHPCR
jgi:hypothetical protein